MRSPGGPRAHSSSELNESLANSAASLATYLAAAKSRSETVAGVQLPRLASSALMRSGHVPTEELVAVADAAHGHGVAFWYDRA